jgi:predicted ArsR family transcriptional regulator
MTAGDLHEQVRTLASRWRADLADVRADSVTHRVLDVLLSHPVISAARVATDCDVSRRTALTGLELLEARGILKELAPQPGVHGRPVRWWTAADLVAAMQRWLG